MFTGIVEEVGTILAARPNRLVIGVQRILPGIGLGDSVAVNGVCLTVTGFDGRSFSVDMMAETRQRSTLGSLVVGDKVNLERALALGGRMGGHLVQGHVDSTGKVVAMNRENDATLIRVEAPPSVMRYVVEKGFIAVDGISLTVVSRDAASFQVSIIDFTLKHSILGEMKVGDPVNLEVDIIAKYVEQLSQTGPFPQGKDGITTDFLVQHGFSR
ncbi:MAG: riboflavin synthase [Chloroflexi bacterium]|nr:riboflavin synthase [Chloroflexota bacterium]